MGEQGILTECSTQNVDLTQKLIKVSVILVRFSLTGFPNIVTHMNKSLLDVRAMEASGS